MRLLIGILVVLFFSVSVTLVVREDPGYVLIAAGNWTAETTVVLLLSALLLMFVISYFVIRFLVQLWTVPAGVQRWRERQRARKARESLNQGLILMAEGSWARALRTLLKQIKHSETPLINYLAAARCAQQLGEHERRDHFLQQAHLSAENADVAVGLTQAELQIAHRQMEQALATVNHLRTLSPKHGYVLKLLMKLYQELGDWEKLRQLLPDLRRHKVLEREAQEELEVRVYSALLDQRALSRKTVELQSLWNQIPKPLRQNPLILSSYTRHLISWDAAGLVEPTLGAAIEQSWNDELVYLYGFVHSERIERQLVRCESWLKSKPANPVLLQTLARLCLHQRLWGKARIYLESSIGASPSVEAYYALGGLLEQLGEPERAADCYRDGNQLAARLAQKDRLGSDRTDVAQRPVKPLILSPNVEAPSLYPVDAVADQLPPQRLVQP